MDLINEWSAYQKYGIMYENERFWNFRDDVCGKTRCILEVERVSLVVERIKIHQIYMKEYMNI